LAFEDDLGHDASQPMAQDYTVSATGLVSRTISLWSRKLAQYIIIVGVINAAFVAIPFVLLLILFDIIGTLGIDPINYVISLFFLESSPELAFIAMSIGFATIAFVINAIISGAAIKFTLDEYGGNRGEIGTSFSHSFGRTLTIIIVQLILSFLVAIVLTPATILATRALEMIDISDPFNPIIPPGAIELLMAALGFFVVGGIILIYFQTRFAPTLAIVIDTDLSAFDSLKKSWKLTSGKFFHVFGSLILLNIAVLILGLIVDAGLTFTLWPESSLLVIESFISALLFSSLSLIFTAILYRDLMSRTVTSDFPEYVL
jgi:hypothetical protein